MSQKAAIFIVYSYPFFSKSVILYIAKTLATRTLATKTLATRTLATRTLATKTLAPRTLAQRKSLILY